MRSTTNALMPITSVIPNGDTRYPGAFVAEVVNTQSGAVIRYLIDANVASCVFPHAFAGTATSLTDPFSSAINYVANSAYTADLSQTYIDILRRQYNRVCRFLEDAVNHLNSTDDDFNEEVVEQIAAIIDLVGEPALFAVDQQLKSPQRDYSTAEKFLLAIASARENETEDARTAVIAEHAQAKDNAIRYAAVHALARLGTKDARRIMENVAKTDPNSQIAHVAKAFSS
jgi:hypothetical protein